MKWLCVRLAEGSVECGRMSSAMSHRRDGVVGSPKGP